MCKAHYKINDWTTEAKLLLTLTTKLTKERNKNYLFVTTQESTN